MQKQANSYLPLTVIIHLLFAIFAYTTTDIFPKTFLISVNNSLKKIGVLSLVYKSDSRDFSFAGGQIDRFKIVSSLVYLFLGFVISYCVVKGLIFMKDVSVKHTKAEKVQEKEEMEIDEASFSAVKKQIQNISL